MPDIATYCPGCCTTYDAHYDTDTGIVTITCPRCPDQRFSINLHTFLHLTERQYTDVQGLLKRTAEREGLPEPPLVKTTVMPAQPKMYPVKIAPLPMETQASDPLTALVEAFKVLGQWWERAFSPLPALPPLEIPLGTSPEVAERMQQMAEMLSRPINPPLLGGAHLLGGLTNIAAPGGALESIYVVQPPMLPVAQPMAPWSLQVGRVHTDMSAEELAKRIELLRKVQRKSER